MHSRVSGELSRTMQTTAPIPIFFPNFSSLEKCFVASRPGSELFFISTGYNPQQPMEGRISDIGPRKYDSFFPPVIAKNFGK